MHIGAVGRRWLTLLCGGAAMMVVLAPGEVLAQQPTGDAMISLQQVIAANANTPKQICPAITPLLRADPSAASAVIENAQAQPTLLEPLCECLSRTQAALKQSDPQGAEIVAKAVATASPAFQACYAVAQAPGEGGGGGAQTAGAGTPSGGGGGVAPFSPVGFANVGGFGGGPASPN